MTVVRSAAILCSHYPHITQFYLFVFWNYPTHVWPALFYLTQHSRCKISFYLQVIPILKSCCSSSLSVFSVGAEEKSSECQNTGARCPWYWHSQENNIWFCMILLPNVFDLEMKSARQDIAMPFCWFVQWWMGRILSGNCEHSWSWASWKCSDCRYLY